MQSRSLVDRLRLGGDRLWVTLPTPQTETMLTGERVHWASAAPNRDWRAVLRNGRAVRRLFRRYDITVAVTTGSSVALSTLPHAALRRIPAHYEGVTRVVGRRLAERGLAIVAAADMLSWDDVTAASGVRARRVDAPPVSELLP